MQVSCLIKVNWSVCNVARKLFDQTTCLQLLNNLLTQLQTDRSNNLLATVKQPAYTIADRLIKQLACNIADRLIEHLVCIENIFSKVILFFIFPKKPSKNFSTDQSKMLRYFLKWWHENQTTYLQLLNISIHTTYL